MLSQLTPADFRQLRHGGETGIGDPDGSMLLAVVVDAEITGIDTGSNRVIELAVRRFEFDRGGQVARRGPRKTQRAVFDHHRRRHLVDTRRVSRISEEGSRQ